jgi:hypothetical protein
LIEATGEAEWLEKSETAVRDFLAGAPDELIDAALDEREGNRCATVTASASQTLISRTYANCRKHCRRCLPPPRCARAKQDSTASNFTTRTRTRWLLLSRRNNRTDGYGGGLDNRVRLPLEVYRAVRERVGDDYVVGVRF